MYVSKKHHICFFNIDDFLAAYVPLNIKFWRLYREEQISKKELRYLRLSKTFQAIDFDASDALINLLAAQYIDYLSTFNHLFDYTEDLLKNLQKHYRLHMITNGFREVQRKKMKAAGILPYFHCIIDSESVHVKKPNPKIFQSGTINVLLVLI